MTTTTGMPPLLSLLKALFGTSWSPPPAPSNEPGVNLAGVLAGQYPTGGQTPMGGYVPMGGNPPTGGYVPDGR
jgi:hypothetical protein